MFKDLRLNATYNSYDDDVGELFYSPTLEFAKTYDRASAYFSINAIANYAKGMERFAKRGNYARMIFSVDISEEDFNQLELGYELRDEIQEDLLKSLQKKISLDEEKDISNFAYLISLGIIDVKLAFTKNGIFHDKFGIFEDPDDNMICFRGSNNETNAAFNSNFESFDITCSWQCSEFDFSKITKSKEIFEKLWNNQYAGVQVQDVTNIVRNEIVAFNKGKIIVDSTLLTENCIILDFEHKLILHNRLNTDVFTNTSTYKIELRRYLLSSQQQNRIVFFKDSLSYIDYKKIIEIVNTDSKKRNYLFLVTNRLQKYIENKELHINHRSKVGLSIKGKEDSINAKFIKYKQVVDNQFERKLREKQMWDSFFMYTMKKSSNFSVPGSGKTASVLGVFAFLRTQKKVRRIVMVGPKNSFTSWIDEFNACFGDKLSCSVFNIQDSKYTGVEQKKVALQLNSGNSNLFLFNYESLPSLTKELKRIIASDTLLVFDEIHKIKAVNGYYATHALDIAKDSLYTIALTGTPIPNTYKDIYNLLNILYHDEYRDFFGFSTKQLEKPTSSDIGLINQKLQPFFCRTSKNELQVPVANSDICLTLNSSNEENDLFKIILMKYRRNKFALIIRLLQLESNPKLLLSNLDPSEYSELLDIDNDEDIIDYIDYSEDIFKKISLITKSSKFDGCIELAKDLMKENKTIIIWCIFKQTMYDLESVLLAGGFSTTIVCGDYDLSERQQRLASFKSGEFQCLITNPHTLAESVSLHTICHDAIYYEYSYNLVHLLQSKDRIHRLGLEKNQYTQYYFLKQEYMNNDESYALSDKIYSRLLEKEQIMLNAIDNNYLELGATTEEDIDIIFKDLF